MAFYQSPLFRDSTELKQIPNLRQKTLYISVFKSALAAMILTSCKSHTQELKTIKGEKVSTEKDLNFNSIWCKKSQQICYDGEPRADWLWSPWYYFPTIN